MSYKRLFPTYRARERFLIEALVGRRVRRALDVGAGEGELDRLLADHAERVDACDVSAEDLREARRSNRDLSNVHYWVGSGEALALEDASVDLVVCLEVIEHVERPEKLLAEIARVLTPGGHAVLSCPSRRFPPTYDPINWLLQKRGVSVPVGAYAYGHDWLVDEQELESWIARAGLTVLTRRRLTGALAALVECYWAGLLQRLLKSNSDNRGRVGRPRWIPSRTGFDPLVPMTDALVRLDSALFGDSRRSVGLGYVLVKEKSGARGSV